MVKKRKKSRSRHGLQAVTLCISTALVLILLGLIVFSVLIGRNLSSLAKENLVVTMMLDQDMTNPEAKNICKMLTGKEFIKNIDYISKEQALQEGKKELGTDPTEFTDGVNPYLSSIELTLQSAYANNDSLKWIEKELQKIPKVSEINYSRDLVENVNRTLAKIGLVLGILALLLAFVSFSLINNTVKLGIYASRFTMHTMKLVGASWKFIRRPFVKRAILLGILAAFIAILVLGGLITALCMSEPELLTQGVITWIEMAVTGVAVFLFGIILTGTCAYVSVNKFLKMKAGELYKI